MVRDQPDPPQAIQETPGGLAQLGEHLLCKQGVVGSIPSSSTKYSVLVDKKNKTREDNNKKKKIVREIEG